MFRNDGCKHFGMDTIAHVQRTQVTWTHSYIHTHRSVRLNEWATNEKSRHNGGNLSTRNKCSIEVLIWNYNLKSFSEIYLDYFCWKLENTRYVIGIDRNWLKFDKIWEGISKIVIRKKRSCVVQCVCYCEIPRIGNKMWIRNFWMEYRTKWLGKN